MTKNFAANLKIGAVMGSSVGRVFGGLKVKIKDQEATLKGLRAAYKEASKGTGEWAGKLAELEKQIREAEAEMKRLKAASKFDIGKSLKGVGSTFLGDAKRLAVGAGLVAGAVAGVGAALYSTTRGFVDWADDIGDSAEALGMSTQALQTWQFAAATVGVGGAKMTASIAKLSKTIMEGGDKTDETLGKLSINADRLRKLGLDEQLEVVAEAFKNYEGADRAAIAMKLFGRSGYQLAGILAKGKEGLDAFRKAGEETGAVLTDEAAKAAGDAASALDMFGITMVGLRNTIAIQFVPALQRMTERFTTLVRENGPQIREWATRFADIVETRVVPALGKFVDKLPGIIEGLSSFAAKTYTVVSAVADFLGGWDRLMGVVLVANFAPTILAIGGLVKGLWGLTGATWAAIAPIGKLTASMTGLTGVTWAAAAPWLAIGGLIAGVGLVIISIVDPGGPLDLLGKMFPETMEKIRKAVESAVNWIGDKFDALTARIKGFLADLGKLTGLGYLFEESPGAGRDFKPGQYEAPKRNYGSILGVKPKAEANPLEGIQPPPPPATKGDLLEFLKPQSSNNTNTNNYNINVNAPGANGEDIAERIRRSFERKPLFDSDSALAPG